MDPLETVTTLPLVREDATGEETYPFWDAVLSHTVEHLHLAAKPQTDPIWAVVLVMVGAFLSVGAGAFLITIGLGQ
jgi:hypothetical protein